MHTHLRSFAKRRTRSYWELIWPYLTDLMQQRLDYCKVVYNYLCFFACQILSATAKIRDFFRIVKLLSCKSCFWGHAGLTLASLSLQCPVSLHRTCEPFLWRPTRQWSHGQSLHGWHCTVCWKATVLCFGPSSPMEVGAVGARPSGQCRVIITYLILNFSNNQPAQHTPPPTYLCVSVVSHKMFVCNRTFLIKHLLFLCLLKCARVCLCFCRLFVVSAVVDCRWNDSSVFCVPMSYPVS